jgi:hypothetical protein
MVVGHGGWGMVGVVSGSERWDMWWVVVEVGGV